MTESEGRVSTEVQVKQKGQSQSHESAPEPLGLNDVSRILFELRMERNRIGREILVLERLTHKRFERLGKALGVTEIGRA